ncbi:MAG: hypothetical protein ACE5FU_12265, partial [Nitrospinota bacterium]
MMLVQFVQGFRAFLLTILIVGVGAGLWASQNLNLDLSLSSRFMKDSSQLASYLKFQNEFGSEPLLFVVWEVPGNIF